MYSTVIFHDTMQVVSTDSSPVRTVYVCGHYVYAIQRTGAEQCYCMSECSWMTTMCSTSLHKIYAYVRTCTEVRMYRMADNKTYKENMQDRTMIAKDTAGSTGQLWQVLANGIV